MTTPPSQSQSLRATREETPRLDVTSPSVVVPSPTVFTLHSHSTPC